uniref:NADH dehydrogenase subunit 3 n=1 Tax=Rhipicephalus haemaphysaloides TaxID=237073 RepID=UPI001FAF9559|nr:NADH dehydrogenase subunit 3 [Rhipicephalus haemaphysaloides]UDU84728.1 NADH dehydrogenase subunit 3 [Rhipicephalus haemaphysaloides]UNO54449.1 NADH dehydrogenase subunit 3 [Rhipicephalus haemaphysaloides]UNO54462.1 NADH dehydrogenase subunit 3 [Rhipicephalus haemaphysaloides]
MFYLYMTMSIVIMLLMILFFSLAFQGKKAKEKNSPFECGFDPFSLSRVPFSLKFFFIGIVFLIFDVEIVVILPFPLMMMMKSLAFMFSFVIINMLIMLGLLYEFKYTMLDWLK